MNLFAVLPELQTKPFAHILPSLERHEISVADLLTIEAADVAKRAHVPTREVRKLTEAILEALSSEYGFNDGATSDQQPDRSSDVPSKILLARSGIDLIDQWNYISLLDDEIDAALSGGVPTGYITEFTGESGVGKTQFLLTLLLSVQLPEPQGLASSAIYISTEAPLQTTRLTQIIASHTKLSGLEESTRPSLSRIYSIRTPDLETQDHILRFQVPEAIRRHGVRLLIIDSVTTNYRAELERGGDGSRPGASMARRTTQLMQLGSMLRNLARSENIAIVVANQVGDRFVLPQSSDPNSRLSVSMTGFSTQAGAGQAISPIPTQTQHPASEPSTITNAEEPENTEPDGPITLEHQQRWFTGWGDQAFSMEGLKTPSLGLIWTNEISCRIALLKRRLHRPLAALANREALQTENSRWSRHMKVVFSPWAPSMNGSRGLEFCVESSGIRAVVKEATVTGAEVARAELESRSNVETG